MGYDSQLARLSLQAFDSNIQKSIEYFLSKQGASSMHDLEKELLALIETNSKNNKSAKSTGLEEASKSLEEMMKAKRAKELLHNSVPEDDEEYLDFNLDDDALFINEYYSLLAT